MFAAMPAAPSPWERDGVRPPVHEATPKAPAKAVSTVMITLSNLLQLKVVLVCGMLNRSLPLPLQREG